MKNQIRLIEYLVSQNANINAKDAYGFTALHYAALTNNLRAAESLLRHENIKVNITCEKVRSKSAMFLSKWLNRLNVCRVDEFFKQIN